MINEELLNKRLSELTSFRKQFESQIHMVDGHIQEIQYLLAEINKEQDIPQEKEASNVEAIEQAEGEVA